MGDQQLRGGCRCALRGRSARGCRTDEVRLTREQLGERGVAPAALGPCAAARLQVLDGTRTLGNGRLDRPVADRSAMAHEHEQ
jgi:hypothetical protein